MTNLSVNGEDILPFDKQKVNQVLLSFVFSSKLFWFFLKFFVKTGRFKITTKLHVIAKYPILHLVGVLQYIKYYCSRVCKCRMIEAVMANLSVNREDILPVDKQKVSQVLLLFCFSPKLF